MTSSCGSTAIRRSRRHHRGTLTFATRAGVISMATTSWHAGCVGYPWFAAWDLAFHTVVFAHIDPEYAKYQLTVMLREWYMHPNGAIPAYEWSFDDRNPPVHAWAALRVFEIDGSRDYPLPRGDLPQTAHQLHLVGQSR